MATLKISSDLQNVIKKVVLDTYFPVGSLYLTVGSENPNNTIGGTWTKLSGYYLYADTSINNTSYTGKHTQNHTLTVNQIPSHNHPYNQWLFNGSSASGTHYGYGWESDTGMMYNNMPSNWGSIGNTGGGQGHLHNIATKGIYVWQRTA